MTRNAKKYLYDISQSISNTFDSHLSGISGLHELKGNITVIRAIEREIGIIGEATKRLRQMGVELTDSDSIINRRNTIHHQYDVIKEETLWSYIHKELPSLKKEVDALLK